MKTLFISVDFSAATRAVVDVAVELAARAETRLILHHAYTPPMVTGEYGLSFEMMQETARIGEQSATHQLLHLEDELTAHGFDVGTVLTHGGAAGHIIEQAAKARADMIVLGSHGHTAFYELLIGSTTHEVLKKATCPVLVVPRLQTRAHTRAAKKKAAASKRRRLVK